jgi:glycosyltransferase involved in cell wall biosynthesis
MRVLVVSYAFPPVGGAGVQRMLKLVKYLPVHGVHASVLTVRDASVPLIDQSLLAEVPAGTTILRAPTLEPRYAAKELAWQASAGAAPSRAKRWLRAGVALGRQVLLPDPQILWLPGAAAALVQRFRTRRDDVVLISGPPFSQFLLALVAKHWAKLPVVLDYRDEWTTTANVYEMASARGADARLERMVLRRASYVVTATEEFRERLLARFDCLRPERTLAIPNGFDPEDFPASLPEPPADRCVLAYTGTVFRLTSVRGFLAGLRLFHERSPARAKQLEVRFAGRIVETEADAFEGSEALGVSRLGVLDDVEGAASVYPAKIFEIMRLGRRCLALTPEGALARLVRRHRAGDVVPPRDAPAIAATLERYVDDFERGTLLGWEGPIDLELFDRRRQAGQFARVLELAHSAAAG